MLCLQGRIKAIRILIVGATRLQSRRHEHMTSVALSTIHTIFNLEKQHQPLLNHL
jgi:hypothetical protein